MLRPPPRSTLFPSRRSSDLLRYGSHRAARRDRRAWEPLRGRGEAARRRSRRDRHARSEEHTSELQSHSDLVCRLLLEKKKKNKNQLHSTDTETQTRVYDAVN